jgi:S-adenosyl-L-methionine hydrolase (adenosine-forming)
MTAPVITLLTDFGLHDTYAASMKGAILKVCPDARLVDISHLVPPRDVRTGAFLLASVACDFPSATIHLAVIDPGVGTGRRGLVIEADSHFFVGPDNGLFSRVLHRASAWAAFSLEDPAYWQPTVSKTFHGRDIFAPVAAHLAMGVPPRALGPPCTPQPASWADVIADGDEILGEIIHIDHFGNAVTNVSRETFERFASRFRVAIRVGGCSISTMAGTYGDQDPARVVALIGSHGYLEIAINQGNAALSCSLQRGDPVTIAAIRSGAGKKQ